MIFYLFLQQVLRLLVRLYMNLKVPDYINVCQCLIFLDDTQAVADILDKLTREGEVRFKVEYKRIVESK